MENLNVSRTGYHRLNGNIQKIILRPTFIYGKGANAIKTLKEKIKSGRFLGLTKEMYGWKWFM
jgi:hypothetical protein